MMAAAAHLDRLWRRGRDFLGTDVAIMGGAMSWVSEHNLVSAISNAGGFGVLACGSMNAAQLAAEIEATQAMTRKPFGVNLITMHPTLDELIATCLRLKVSHVVLAGGIPKGESIAVLKRGGIKVFSFSPTLGVAKKLVRLGADALIIEGAEAGGHIGAVSTTVLAQEILPNIREVPVFVAGGIGRGEAIISYLEMGAAGVQLGTRFVCATECVAHPKFKRAFIKAQARDAVPSVQVDPNFPVAPVRAITNEAARRYTTFQVEVINRYRSGEIDQKAAQLQIEHYWAGALRRAVIEGDVELGSVMAGQSVGLVTKEQPTSEVIAELVDQAVRALLSRYQVEATL